LRDLHESAPRVGTGQVCQGPGTVFANRLLTHAHVVGWRAASPSSLDERGAEPRYQMIALVLTGFVGLVMGLMLSYTTGDTPHGTVPLVRYDGNCIQ
jgi:hypothetical protein